MGALLGPLILGIIIVGLILILGFFVTEGRAHQRWKEGGGEFWPTTSRQTPTATAQSPHELRALHYEEYLQTPHWKGRREDKLRAVGHRCQVCNSGLGTLDVHHRTYERLGQELDEDLTVLCRACHSIFHEQRHPGR